MPRLTGLCLAFTLLLPLAAQAQDAPIRWSAWPADRGKVQLKLSQGDRMNNQDWDASELQGLDTRFPGGPLAFRIQRQAGTLSCTGNGREGRGEGTCRFARDASYFDGLARRDVRVTADLDAWQLALFDVRLELLDELRRQDYRTPSVKDLIAAGIFQIDAAFVRALGAAGYRQRELDDLIPFRIHRITPGYIRSIKAANPRLKLETKDLVALHIHGVTPEWVEGWAKLGYDLDVKQLTNTRIHNVSPDYARAMMAEVRDKPTLDQFVAMRIHGVKPGR